MQPLWKKYLSSQTADSVTVFHAKQSATTMGTKRPLEVVQEPEVEKRRHKEIGGDMSEFGDVPHLHWVERLRQIFRSVLMKKTQVSDIILCTSCSGLGTPTVGLKELLCLCSLSLCLSVLDLVSQMPCDKPCPCFPHDYSRPCSSRHV